MKLENIPTLGPSVEIADLSPQDLFERYDYFLGVLQDLQKRLVLKDELPEILIEAVAFRFGCNDHETCRFEWSPWDIEHPSQFLQIAHFIEKCGQHDLATEVRAFAEKLSIFSEEEVVNFITDSMALPTVKADAISDIFQNGFDTTKFGEALWPQTARVGVELIESSGIFREYLDNEDFQAAQRDLVNMLPDYESRLEHYKVPRNALPFHELLISVSERYFHDINLKLTRHNGSLSIRSSMPFTGIKHNFDKLPVFEEASRVDLVQSTTRDWLCCKVGETAWLVDPIAGNKVVSVPCVKS